MVKADKCAGCKWLVVMSFCDGKTVDPSRKMCHYNWKECKAVREDECHFKAKARPSENK